MQADGRFAVDLITFYNGSFWSVADWHELAERAAKEPRWFWDRVLDEIAASGITGVEVTFPPGDWDTAVAAFGSLDGLAEAAGSRGLQIVSSYFSGVEMAEDALVADVQDKILAEATEEARRLAAVGAGVMVLGMPSRPSPESGQFVDLPYVQALAGLVNRLGAAARKEGVRLALHTEMDSVFCLPRDIDAFMLATDPEHVGLCPDTGHIVLGGGDPLEVLRRHGDRVVITHWKDATGPMTGEPSDEDVHVRHARYFRRVGMGTVDWFAWARELRRLRYGGWNILEIDEVPDPVPEVAGALAYAQVASSRP
ncbi:MAG: sugar phosphate isomerase/epimerase family protein [Acidimicrobiales bacterium]